MVRPVLDLFDPPYMQRAALAVAIVAVPLGLLGTWVVLRSLAFFAHAASSQPPLAAVESS